MKDLMYKKCMMLLACLLCMTFSVLAESITFTWGAGTSVAPGVSKSFNVSVTSATIDVDWGEGLPPETVTPNSLGDVTHTYSLGNDYDVTVTTSGSFLTFACNNTNVTYLDVRDATTALTTLNCSSNAGLVLEPLTANTTLTTLNCSSNRILNPLTPWPVLDLSSNTALATLNCSNNLWATLDVSANTNLKTLNCSYNQLTALDVKAHSVLETLQCQSNLIGTLTLPDPPAALTSLACSNNLLTTLKVDPYAGLTTLECADNQLNYLDLTDNKLLKTLICNDNKLDSIHYSSPLPPFMSNDGTVWTNNNSLLLGFLFEVSEQITSLNNKLLGTQELDTVRAAVQWTPTEMLPYHPSHVDMENVAPTQFEVTRKGGMNSGDYTIDASRKIIFSVADTFTVTMTNEAITSSLSFPAKLIAYYDVLPGYNITTIVSGCGNADVVNDWDTSQNHFDVRNKTVTSFIRKGSLVTFDFNVCDSCTGVVLKVNHETKYTYNPQTDPIQIAHTYAYNVDGADTIEIIFDPALIIIATAGSNGSISPSGNVEVACRGDKTFELIPDDCYEIDNLSVNDTITSPDFIDSNGIGYYTFNNVTESGQTIHVTFKNIEHTITATVIGSNGGIDPVGDTTVYACTNVTYNFIPDDCYRVDQVFIDGIPLGFWAIRLARLTNSYTFYDVRDDHTIDVTFTIITYPIAAVAVSNGSITPDGITLVDCDDSITYTITPDKCYEISAVYVDFADVTNELVDGTYTFRDVRGPHFIAATFQPVAQFLIVATSGPNGTITPDGNIYVDCGDDQTFTFTPNLCYAIDKVMVDGMDKTDSVKDGKYTFYDIDRDHTIHVTFKEARPFIDVYSNPSGGGKVYPNGWIFPQCEEDVTFEILPNPGYKINRVYVDGENDSLAVVTGFYTFYGVVGNHTLVAEFIFIGNECDEPLFITATAATSGGSISPSGSAPVPCHGSKTFKIYANAGYLIEGIYINGVKDPATIIAADQKTGEHTFIDVIVSQSIVAKFKKEGFTIESSTNTGGTITPLGEVTVLLGGNQAYTMSAQTGYQISEVLIDGVNNTAAVGSGKYTFSNVTASHTIELVCQPRQYTIVASTGANGDIDPKGSVPVFYGTNQTFTFTPNAGFKIDKVLVDGKNNVAAVVAGYYTFTGIAANHTIAVTYATAPKSMGAPGGEGDESKTIVYPNPTTGELKIQNDGAEINTVLIFDMTGRLIQEIQNVNNTEVSIDMSTYSDGIYFLNVDGQNIKVVKQ